MCLLYKQQHQKYQKQQKNRNWDVRLYSKLQKELEFGNSQEGGYFLVFFTSILFGQARAVRLFHVKQLNCFSGDIWQYPPLPKTKKSCYQCFTWNNMHLVDKFSIFCWEKHIISVKKLNKPLLQL
jgi:hypothetical protein